ncbi:hypothetical protein EON80_10005 [bacterium]|nr:MAG: hypothetical protein EON80_10005 [bacterium]
MAAVPKSTLWKYSYAAQAPIGENGSTQWLLFYSWSHPKQRAGAKEVRPPNSNYARLIVVGHLKTSPRRWSLLNTIGLNWVQKEKDFHAPTIFWFNPGKKQGQVINDGLGNRFWAFPDGLAEDRGISQKFEPVSFGASYYSYEPDGVDAQGILRIRTFHNFALGGDGMTETRNGNLWLWDGHGWTEQKMANGS